MAEHRYTVRGHWPFPTDMLRHDGSEPAEEVSSSLIERLSAEHSTDRSDFVDVEIHLRGPCKPNTARWESFGWQVPTDLDHLRFKNWKTQQDARNAVFDGALAKLTADERAEVLSRIETL
jgi:hypothetical protein